MSAASRALTWAKGLRAPADIRGAALTLAMECSEGTAGKECVYAGSALKLQSLLDCSEATLRRYTTYLAYVGFLDRLNGRGARDGLRLRLRTETPIAEINDKIEVVGRHHAFFRPTVDTDAQLLRSELSEVDIERQFPRSELSEVPETTLNTERSEPVAPVELHTHARARARVNYQDSITSQSPGLNVQEELKETTNVVSDAKPRRPGTETSRAIAAVTVAIQARGWNRYRLPGPDQTAIKRGSPGLVLEAADDIADCWSDLLHKRWGTPFDQSHVSVQRIINQLLPSYQAWVADGRPPPQPAYTNGRPRYANAVGYDTFGGQPTNYDKFTTVIGGEDDDG